MRKNIIVGLDVGSANIRAVVGGRHPETGKIEIITAATTPSCGLRRGVIVDNDEASLAIQEIIRLIEQKADISIDGAFVSISGNHVETKTSKGVVAVSRADGEVDDEDIERVIAAAATFSLPKNRQILHTVPQDFSVDKETGIENPRGMTGVRLELNALIAEAFKPHINNLIECLEKAGLKNNELVFSPLAACLSCLSRKQKELGVVLIDIGAANTEIAVYEENLIRHAAVLPIGSSHITNDLAIAFKIPIDLAEALKLKFGSALAAAVSANEKVDFKRFGINEDKIERKEVAKIIEARVREIMELVNKELKTINRDKMLPAGAVLVGGGAKLSHIAECAKDELGLPAQIGYPTEIEGMIDEVNSPEYILAVGLLKWPKRRGKFAVKERRKSPRKIFRLAKEFFRNLMP